MAYADQYLPVSGPGCGKFFYREWCIDGGEVGCFHSEDRMLDHAKMGMSGET